jgi:hypothetical protein
MLDHEAAFQYRQASIYEDPLRFKSAQSDLDPFSSPMADSAEYCGYVFDPFQAQRLERCKRLFQV